MIELADLTDGVTASEHFRAAGLMVDSAEPTYVRHKPGETTIIAYRLGFPDGETWGYAHWCANPARAAQIFAKSASMAPRPSVVGPGLVLVDAHTVLYTFPNDARLRRLRWYVDSRKLKRSLQSLCGADERISGRRTSVEVLRYKPERRVVLKVGLATNQQAYRPLLLRYSTQSRAPQLATIATHLARNGIRTPTPVAQLENHRVSVDEFVDGRQLLEVVREGELDSASVAEALLDFHAVSPFPNPEGSGYSPDRTAVVELGKASQGLSGLCAWCSELGSAAQRLGELLKRTVPGNHSSQVLLHGDLHAKNILVSDKDILFVDLERVGVGPAAIDLGYFRAHALSLGIRRPGWSPRAIEHAEAVIDHYRRRSANAVDSQALAWHTAIGLIDQALLVARHLEGQWRTTSSRLLNAATEQLDPKTTSLETLNEPSTT